MEPKTIIALCSLAVAVFMIFKDQIFGALKSSTTPSPSTPSPVAQFVQTTPSNKKVYCLDGLEELISALDAAQDEEDINYLIDKVGPKILRRKLGK